MLNSYKEAMSNWPLEEGGEGEGGGEGSFRQRQQQLRKLRTKETAEEGVSDDGVGGKGNYTQKQRR